ncbi:methanogenesis marker 9 domain-containing protein [Methanosarcina sp. KYL-1]|uniref:methanogenesis marker 9 domain-containing protein n=1 Tax=Methanosarcina sp. KYL-1 TaxID=2602068 RepID=UPI002101793F|nr:methanogenesis marker 9 domain-containing protein [Methanosarcina sp. KYL-1]MCQ1536036.1 methanogenesis marker 9 domain-containing protein [Methanosarcina sp. KYL-1]
MSDDLFNLHIGYVCFKNPIALAPMAGIVDSAFANHYAGDAGLVVLGAFNIDEGSISVASQLAARGRKEFISDEPMELIKKEIRAVTSGSAVAVNVRSTTLDPLIELAKLVRDEGAILELNAHCRQPEMLEAGLGEALLRDLPRLSKWIRAIKETGVVLSVKVRANIVDDAELARVIDKAGADIIHVDAMLEGFGPDMDAILTYRDATRLFLIGNNSVTDFIAAKEMFSRGADMVSVARGAMDDPELIRKLVESVNSYQEIIGWYNAPKHVCSDGDFRALAFCCMPVKPCPVHEKFKKLGYTAEEFARTKMEFARGTLLEFGEDTCFGSLVWCCKITKPCWIRDGALNALDLSDSEYMRLKEQLAKYILDHARIPVNESR